MTIDRPNLSDAFAKRPVVDRSAKLAGLLPAPARIPEAVPASQPNAVDATASQSKAPPPAVRNDADTAAGARRRAARPVAPLSQQASVVTNVAVYLEPDLLDLIKQRRRASGLNYDELAVEAFDDVDDERLTVVFRPTPASTGTTGMPSRQRRIRGTAGIQVQLRLDANQRAWIDQKREAVGAPSRSALVAAALRLYLTR